MRFSSLLDGNERSGGPIEAINEENIGKYMTEIK